MTTPQPFRRRGVFAWMLFDWANQPFQTLVVTFVFAPYFAATVAGDPAISAASGSTRAGGTTSRFMMMPCSA